ncbi:MAG: aminotransferase class III-fold pyridoxal phosphate-dependent enzyme [Actinobacteria bacterium]|nr:aminotransferase class III-fold pyridoxal phosphate-dependent enzyme [Actinomycetota bacterium]
MSTYADNAPLIIERAEGRELIDVDGNRYLDAISSLWVTTLGHRVPELDDALREQVDRIAHSTLLGNGNVAAIQLGDAEMARSALNSELATARMMGTVADHELELLGGITEMLAGNVSEARTMIEGSASTASNEGQVAYSYGALAIAYAADREPKLALDAADRSMAAKGGTYLDRQLAKTGQALAFAQQDDRRALTVADELVKRANESTDSVAQATALLVRASVACALRIDDATEHAADADQALDDLGADLPGWRDVYASAATPASRLDPA